MLGIAASRAARAYGRRAAERVFSAMYLGAHVFCESSGVPTLPRREEDLGKTAHGEDFERQGAIE